MTTPNDGDTQQQRLEYSVIGFALAYPDQFYELEDLTPEHFLHPTVRRMFKVMLRLWKEHGAPAIQASALVSDHLVHEGIAESDAFALVVECKDFAPESPGAIVPIVKSLVDGATRRAIAAVAHEMKLLAEQVCDSDEMVSAAMELVNDASRKTQRVHVTTMADEMQREIDRITNEALEVGGHRTGLVDLDEQLGGGIRGGEMIVVGGRPGMGKSSLSNHFAFSLAATTQHVPGVIFSLEMRAAEVAQRMICCHASVDMQRARKKALSPHEQSAYIETARALETAPISIVDQGGISMARIAAVARRLRYERNIGWMAVDYLQLIDHTANRSESTNDAITRSSKQLKALALSLDIPVIVLSQLNRDCEKRDNKRPRLSDLRSSGSIEQDADVVILIYRGAMYYTPEEEDQAQEGRSDVTDEVELIVAKQRNGPVGTVRVRWDRRHARFFDDRF